MELDNKGLKVASRDRAKELYGIGRGGGTGRLGGSINNDTGLVLDDETNLVLGSSISDKVYLELEDGDLQRNDKGDLKLDNEGDLELDDGVWMAKEAWN